MNMIVFTAVMYIFGVLVGLLLRPKIPAAFIAISGLLWGTIAVLLYSLLLGVSGISYNTINFLGGLTLLFLALVFVNYRLGKFKALGRGFWLTFAGVLGAHVALSILFWKVNLTFRSTDTFRIIVAGRNLYGLSTLFEFVTMIFYSRYTAINVVMQSYGRLLGETYNWAISPNLYLAMLFVFFYTGRNAVRRNGIHPVWGNAFLILFGLVLLFTPFNLQMIAYINGQLPAAVFLTCAVLMFFTGILEREPQWYFLGVFGLLGFYFARIEGAIFNLLLILLLLQFDRFSTYRKKLAVFTPYMATVFGWEAIQLVTIKFQTGSTSILDVLSANYPHVQPDRIYYTLAATAALLIVLLLSRFAWMQQLVRNATNYVVLAAVLGAAVILAWDVKSITLIRGINSFILNVQSLGGYGATILGFAGLLLLGQFLPEGQDGDKFLRDQVILYLIGLIGLGWMRSGYRLGWGDSGNRMLYHILPVFAFYLFIRFASALTVRPAADPVDSQPAIVDSHT
ncbi:MAG: hypothetical protein JXB38_16665 [Anaerolineales bacterium]|nr:hypothetical protein [Anaerolineales bacterium]